MELIDRVDCDIPRQTPSCLPSLYHHDQVQYGKAAAGKPQQEHCAKTKLAYTEYLCILEAGGKPKVKTIADAFGVPCTNLQNMTNGVESKGESAVKCQILYEQEEIAMIQYLIETAKHGFPDTPQCTIQCANQIL